MTSLKSGEDWSDFLKVGAGLVTPEEQNHQKVMGTKWKMDLLQPVNYHFQEHGIIFHRNMRFGTTDQYAEIIPSKKAQFLRLVQDSFVLSFY